VNRKNILFAILAGIFLIALSEKAIACHSLPLVGLTFTPANGGTLLPGQNLVINGSSDAATCGCGDYYMEIELICNLQTFTGNPTHGTVIIDKSSCTLTAYPTLTVPTSNLCPGTTYKWRIRERITGGGPNTWQATVYTFTTAGSPPPPPSITLSANPSTLACGDEATLNAQTAGVCSGIGVTWSHFLGTGGTTRVVAPTSTTTYTVSGTDNCTGQTVTATATVTVPPNTNTVNISKCPADVVNLNPTGITSVKQFTPVTLSNNMRYPLKNLQTTASPITVSGLNYTSMSTPSIQKVIVNISHGRAHDLDIRLRSPSGTLYDLFIGNNTTNGANFVNTNFVHQIPQGTGTPIPHISAGAPSFTGNFIPQAAGTGIPSFIAFNNQNPNGIWELVVNDKLNNTFEGSIENWTLIIHDENMIQNPNYSWNSLTNLIDPFTSTPSTNTPVSTTYILTSGNNGCTYEDIFNITVHPEIGTVNPSVNICPGDVAQLNATGADAYSWSNPYGTISNPTSQSPTDTPPQTTTYQVQLFDNVTGCVFTKDVIVNVGTIPVPNAGGPHTICLGSTAQLQATGGASYQWLHPFSDPTDPQQVVSPTATTSYDVQVFDQFGCMAQTSVTIIPGLQPQD
jgi:subtilisin-like proprotein convertase family protein